jgi:hypothetical protein
MMGRMSITLFIENDTDKSVVESYDCDWCDSKGCSRCENGKINFRSSKWEMNMANGNFSTLMSALGIDLGGEYCGAFDARILLAALDRFIPTLAIRGASEERTDAGALIIDCGTSLEYVIRRTNQMREIATEAAKREEKIVWG